MPERNVGVPLTVNCEPRTPRMVGGRCPVDREARGSSPALGEAYFVDGSRLVCDEANTASRISLAAWFIFVAGLPGDLSWSSMRLSFQQTIRSRLGTRKRTRIPPWPLAANASGGASTK